MRSRLSKHLIYKLTEGQYDGLWTMECPVACPAVAHWNADQWWSTTYFGIRSAFVEHTRMDGCHEPHTK